MPPWLCRVPPWLCPPPAPPDPAPPGPLQAGWLAALNAQRARYGLTPMATDPRLAGMAQDWAADMASHGQLTHGDFQGRITAVLPGVVAAEDIAEGQPDVAAAMAAWMSSPAHRANILGPYNRTGIGRAVSPSGLVFWTADFIRE